MKPFVLLFTFFFTGFFVFAQEMKSWTWDAYKMKFEIPSDFEVSSNDETVFSAGNYHINLTIYPVEVNMTYETMADYLTQWANETNLTFDMTATYIEQSNGYWGCYIDGTAANGNPTSVFIFVDPDYTEIGFYVWIQYQDEYFDEALEILKSFTPN